MHEHNFAWITEVENRNAPDVLEETIIFMGFFYDCYSFLNNLGAGLILYCCNTHLDSGPGFTIFPFFQAKSRFKSKNCTNCLSSIAYKTCLSRCMTFIMGSL